MQPFEIARQQVVEAAQGLARKGYLMAAGGNLSVRIQGRDAIAITPSNYDYVKMTLGDVCILNSEGQVQEGCLAPSVESSMHLAIDQVRADVKLLGDQKKVESRSLDMGGE